LCSWSGTTDATNQNFTLIGDWSQSVLWHLVKTSSWHTSVIQKVLLSPSLLMSSTCCQ
jgi:hypothetical protein